MRIFAAQIKALKLSQNIAETVQSQEISTSKVKDFTQLLKLRLSWLVVFSALTAFFMGGTAYTANSGWIFSNRFFERIQSDHRERFGQAHEPNRKSTDASTKIVAH